MQQCARMWSDSLQLPYTSKLVTIVMVLMMMLVVIVVMVMVVVVDLVVLVDGTGQDGTMFSLCTVSNSTTLY